MKKKTTYAQRVEPARNRIFHESAINLPQLPSNSVHQVVTSIPYFQQRSYLRSDDPLKDQEIGLESSIDEYIANIVAAFREVRRYLRPDGSVYINVDDSWSTNPRGHAGFGSTTLIAPGIKTQLARGFADKRKASGLPRKNALLIPERLKIALQDDGWYVRCTIIWWKSASAMPCAFNDRPAHAFEQLIVLSKTRRYYYDRFAIAEPLAESSIIRMDQAIARSDNEQPLFETEPALALQRKFGPNSRMMRSRDPRHTDNNQRLRGSDAPSVLVRNAQDVWVVPPRPVRGKHPATMSPDVVAKCIAAGTSEGGCCAMCGKPRLRVIDTSATTPYSHTRTYNGVEGGIEVAMDEHVRTLGWESSCAHDAPSIPCLVADPFAGAGTTPLVAESMGRSWTGSELNREYINEIIRVRTAQQSLFSGDGALSLAS